MATQRVRLDDLLEDKEDGLLHLDRQMNVVGFNQAISEILGLERSDIGGSLQDLLEDAGGLDEILEGARKILIGQKVAEGYQVAIGEHEYSLRYLPLRGKTSMVETVLLIFREVSSPLHVEQRFDFAMQAALMNWWEWHLNTDDIYFHSCDHSLLGCSEEELPTCWDEWIELVHPYDREHVEKNLDACLAGETDLWYCECRVRTRYGGWIWLDNRGKVIRRDRRNRPIEMMGTLQDIDAKKRAHIDMRAKNDMLEKVGELIKVGTWEYIPDTGQITWSKETRRILGVDDRFQASAEAFWGFVHPDDLEKIQTAFADTIENGTEYNLKVRCITARGELITVRTACKTRYDVYGTLVSVAGVFQDISDMGHAFDQDGFL